MTSLKMASGFHKEESIFKSSLRPSRFSPLYLSHESMRDGKVSTEGRVVGNNNGVVRFRAAKYSQKVLSTVVLEIPLKWNCLSLHANFRFVMNFLLFEKITFRI